MSSSCRIFASSILTPGSCRSARAGLISIARPVFWTPSSGVGRPAACSSPPREVGRLRLLPASILPIRTQLRCVPTGSRTAIFPWDSGRWQPGTLPPLSSVPSPGHFGNSGIGIIEGPGTIAWSARVFKYFSLRERLRLRIDGLLDNVLNHPNFGFAMYQVDSGLNVTTAAKGRITTTNNVQSGANFDASRVVKLSVRLEF